MEDLISYREREALVANGLRARADPGFDPVPVVMLRAPDGPQAWLLAELDPDDGDLAYGLCDLGVDTPEPGNVSLAWLRGWRGELKMPLERDPRLASAPQIGLSHWARIAFATGRIVI